MAKIIVAPGETFSHIHDTDSLTDLESGQAKLVLASEQEVMLERNKPVKVGAGVKHTIVNTGKTDAVILCYHK